jgi:kinesin family protein C1
VATLRATVSEMSTTHIVAESQRAALQAQLSTLQCARDSDQSTVSGLKLALEAAQGRILTLEEEARTAEMLRRKLHNTIQELKGNIRVFCRVRPLLSSEIAASASITDGDVNMDAARREEEIKAQMDFPDKLEQREIVLQGSSESAMGQQRKETWNFAFDRVFEPGTTQATVFEEVSQLAQSVTDGKSPVKHVGLRMKTDEFCG